MFGLTYAEAPPAARALAEGISGLSERCWCAEWLIDCEFFLWGLVDAPADEPAEWGDGFISPEEVGELRALAAECNGWVMWKDSLEEDPTKAFLESGPYYVPMSEWLPYYRSYMQTQIEREKRERERALMRRV